MNTQLSLFDTSTVVETTYKIGDRVKLKRKSPHAACLKKGDLVEIEAIHPHNGSCKFWNELTESWGYLYPDEFTLLPPAEIDSVSSNAQVADTEYTVPPAEIDSVSSNAQVADTEYTVPPADGDDSVSSNAQVADTEYTVPPADSDDSLSTKAISIYRPRGTARSGEYFRFSYREGSKMRHLHIRGGNTDSPIAQGRVEEVRSALTIRSIPTASSNHDSDLARHSSKTFVRLIPEAVAICE
jgi:hypothetical protein